MGPARIRAGRVAATLVHVGNGNDLVVWTAPIASDKFHYNAVELKPKGGVHPPPPTYSEARIGMA